MLKNYQVMFIVLFLICWLWIVGRLGETFSMHFRWWPIYDTPKKMQYYPSRDWLREGIPAKNINGEIYGL